MSHVSKKPSTSISINETFIRRYTDEDIPLLVEAVAREVPQLPHYEGISVDPERIKFLLHNSCKDESAFMVALLCDSHTKQVVGGVGAYCVTMLLSNEKATNDIFLFIVPQWRSLTNAMKLIKAYKEWAHRRKAKIIGATHTGGYRSSAMDALLKQAGFKPVGTLYHL